MANQQGNRTWISFVFAKFRDFVFPTLLFFLFFRLISFFWSDSLILSFSTRNAFPFIEDYLYSIDKSQGTWKIGHDNVLCWQKQEIICQKIRCFTNKCNYNRDCGLTICCATTHIQNNLELNNKNHFRSEIVMSVRPLNFLRTSPPFLLQTPTPPPPTLWNCNECMALNLPSHSNPLFLQTPSHPPYHSMPKGTNEWQKVWICNAMDWEVCHGDQKKNQFV